MSWTNDEIEKVYIEVRKKAMLNKTFRDLLLKDPNKAIEEVAGKPIPDSFKIKIIENDPNYHMTFILPDLISEELTDNLDQVAGGVSVALIVSVCGAAVGVGPNTGACGAEAAYLDPCGGHACGAAR